MELGLSWSKECTISETSVTPGLAANLGANLPVLPRAAI